MRLPENLRASLKKPMGLLIPDSETSKDNILKTIPKGAFLITVGDATTEKMIRFGLEPPLQIVDSMEKRNKRETPSGKVKTVLSCSNPPAEITPESIESIKKALKEATPVRIMVTGEEDLLVLPAVLYAPKNSVVMYGQPNEGLVVVTVNQETREKAQKIMDDMSRLL